VQSLPEGSAAVDAARSRDRPLVVLDQPEVPGAPLVGIDDVAGASAAVAHLTALGHRRIAVVTMPLRADGRSGPADGARQAAVGYPVMRRRLAGAAAAAVAAGLAWARIPVLECTANTPAAAAEVVAPLLGGPDAPTAVVALSDQLALGVLRAAATAGVPVPGALSVVGFDDSPTAAGAVPPLTTVAQPLLERGSEVGALVRALLRGEQVQSPPPRPVRLVVRGSTAPPADPAGVSGG
jgi:DNA-binding LacI/PurR family transcriptional regulator